MRRRVESIPADWRDLSYLARGTQKQRQAHRALQSLGVFHILRNYTPLLAGTLPLDMDVEGSDLDIICEAHDLDELERAVILAFGQYAGFHIERMLVGHLESTVANFHHAGFLVQIFAQARPVTGQNAYLHLIVEARLLAIGGMPARVAIRRFKRAGLKTEPAFAQYFRLEGDPYAVLLGLSSLNDEELRGAIERGKK